MNLYTLAAAQGYAPAQSNLGIMFEGGRGVDKDVAKAAELYGQVRFRVSVGNLFEF